MLPSAQPSKILKSKPSKLGIEDRMKTRYAVPGGNFGIPLRRVNLAMNDDLISRSAAKKEFEDILLTCDYKDEDIVEYLRDRIELLPAVDAAPVRHGKWNPYYEPMECFVDVYLNTEIRDVHMGWICSECGRYEQHGTTEEMPYCHCGAKMDAEVEG